ncbi:MAG: FtsK/SpoIIIE domain-containing protein [Sarcina sp.]
MLEGLMDGLNVIAKTTLDLFFKGNKMEYMFTEIGLINKKGHTPRLRKTVDGVSYTAYLFTIPIGLSIKDFEQNKYEIAQGMKEDVNDLNIEWVNNQALITVKRENKEISYNYTSYEFDDKLRIPIGINLINSEIVYWEFLKTAHLLIAGSTGGGKSVALGVVVSHIIKHFPGAKLYLQDTKWVDLFLFENAKQVEYYCDGREGIEEVLSELIGVMDERYKLIRSLNCRDISSYNAKAKDKIQPIFLVIEEMATFNSKDKNDNEFYESLKQLLNKGRGCLIEVILTTQTPYVESIPGILKNALGNILGLRCNTTQASFSVCGEDHGLTKLKGNGHGRFYTREGEQELQVFNIRDDEIENIVKCNSKK